MTVEQLAKIIAETKLGTGWYLKPKDALHLAETIIREAPSE